MRPVALGRHEFGGHLDTIVGSLDAVNRCVIRISVTMFTRLIYGHVSSRLAWTHIQTRSVRLTEAILQLPTLDPEKLSSSSHVPRNISQLSHVSFSIPTRDSVQRANIRYITQNRLYIPFPDNTCGFLYYKGPKPEHPDFAGSLRFRVVSGPNSDSFANGVDLRLPTGGIWQIHMYSVVRTERHAGLLSKLLEEGLVSPSTVEKIWRMPLVLLRSAHQVLYNLEDPFIARLHCVDSLFCMTQAGIGAGQIMPIFLDSRQNMKLYPYEGFVLARFERSTLAEHTNTRTISLRILKHLSPIRCVLSDYDAYIAMPTPGQLVSGIFYRGGYHQRPWCANLDKGKGKASKLISLLWPRHPDEKNNT